MTPSPKPGTDTPPAEINDNVPQGLKQVDAFKTLKYSLLGPSLLKAGQDKVDQNKV